MIHKTQKTEQKKVVLLGAQGQLGRALLQLPSSFEWVGAGRQDVDLNVISNGLSFLEKMRPDFVINAAAFTQVDLAEQESERARVVNAIAPGAIAQWCASQHIPFVHVSTDYVFSGQGTTPWKETDPIAPLNIYGQTKAEGESLVQKAGGKSLIFRTSWVYDHQGKNFLRTMIRLGQERDHLCIVNDQYGAPTYAADLAQGICTALEQASERETFPTGIYHLSNEGVTTWFEFANTIFKFWTQQGQPLKVKSVEPILSSEFPTPALRPKNSRLDTRQFEKQFGFLLPHWRQGLERCMQLIR